MRTVQFSPIVAAPRDADDLRKAQSAAQQVKDMRLPGVTAAFAGLTLGNKIGFGVIVWTDDKDSACELNKRFAQGVDGVPVVAKPLPSS